MAINDFNELPAHTALRTGTGTGIGTGAGQGTAGSTSTGLSVPDLLTVRVLCWDNSLTAVAERVLVGFNRVQHPQLDDAFACGPWSRKVLRPLLFRFPRY